MDNQIGDLYVELYSYLLTLIRNRIYVGCPDDYVYDCLNDVFEVALRKQSDPNFQRNPKGWLIITTRNVVDNYNRKTLGRLSYYYLDYDMNEISREEDMAEDLVYKLAMENHVIEKAMKTLSDQELKLYKMRFKEDMKPNDIANRLELKPSAVNTRLTRLKNKITTFIHAAIY